MGAPIFVAVISADSSSASPHRRLDFLSVMERGYNEFQEARPLYAQLVGGKHDPERQRAIIGYARARAATAAQGVGKQPSADRRLFGASIVIRL